MKHMHDDKNYYPTNNSGIIDEWAAITKHQDSLFHAYQDHQQVIKKQNQQEYLKELQIQKEMKDYQKHQEDEERRLDYQQMKERDNNYKAYLGKKNAEKEKMKYGLADQYEHEIEKKGHLKKS